MNSNLLPTVSFASSKSFLISTGPTCLYTIDSEPSDDSWSHTSSSYLILIIELVCRSDVCVVLQNDVGLADTYYQKYTITMQYTIIWYVFIYQWTTYRTYNHTTTN